VPPLLCFSIGQEKLNRFFYSIVKFNPLPADTFWKIWGYKCWKIHWQIFKLSSLTFLKNEKLASVPEKKSYRNVQILSRRSHRFQGRFLTLTHSLFLVFKAAQKKCQWLWIKWLWLWIIKLNNWNLGHPCLRTPVGFQSQLEWLSKKSNFTGVFLSIKNSTGVGKFNLLFAGMRTKLLFLKFTLLQDFPRGNSDWADFQRGKWTVF